MEEREGAVFGTKVQPLHAYKVLVVYNSRVEYVANLRGQQRSLDPTEPRGTFVGISFENIRAARD